MRIAMNADLNFVRERIDPYRAYADEADRHDSDMRVRAYVGNALTQAQAPLGEALDATTRGLLETVLMKCMFTDQAFIRKFEHGPLDEPTVAALVRSDRNLLDSADRARSADAGSMAGILHEIDREFEARRSPEPVA
ncbi:MAG: hypothetical protein GIX03_13945 [Candidatus Eremiobacteraeota bacterium]|nr:hypothetical protein [Candidatus Eremiobacteraeota bacterium]MBC5804069.1 hypothetical protein [Candidatus Eremiobacteraeota bacterium]MBC5821644.1 hypothetical protein [Candidatus Eremiobacteraeota bacterium]